MPGDDLTHGPPATKNAGGSHHRFGRINRHSLRDGLTVYIALSPVTVLSCPRRPLRKLLRQNLTSASGAPGPHDFAVRVQPRSSDVPSASTASPPHVS